MEQPSISLCMIVRNEEEYLPKCLSSVRRVVDEIIIVDTGSTDNTVSIAEAFGAKVIQMPWEDSFSVARNRSFEEATGDWILWLDADEEMDVNEAGRLKELLTRDTIHEQSIEGILFYFCNYTDGSEMEHTCLPRMVRNRPEYRFEGRIHERILPSMLQARPDMTMAQVDIHVYHYGDLAQNVVRQDKIRRNISLIHQSIREHPEDGTFHYYLGLERCRSNEWEEALEHFHIAVAKPAGFSKQLLSCAHRSRLFTLETMGRYHDLVHYSTESIALFPDYTDLYHLRADGWHALGERDKAISSMRQALSLGPAPEEYLSIPGIGTYLTCRELGTSYASAGNLKESDLYLTLSSLMGGDTRIVFREAIGS
ncbi:glycosyltransferase [Paenibacillus terreus]|uniref:Glycosyltransferase n=1 Tax=Paenibacillus terreus TaxID=1387834 RepID=A0ABV5BKF2_9BACL